MAGVAYGPQITKSAPADLGALSTHFLYDFFSCFSDQSFLNFSNKQVVVVDTYNQTHECFCTL